MPVAVWSVNRFLPHLSWILEKPSVSTTFYHLTTLHQCFTCVHLLYSHLTVKTAFSSNAHYLDSLPKQLWGGLFSLFLQSENGRPTSISRTVRQCFLCLFTHYLPGTLSSRWTLTSLGASKPNFTCWPLISKTLTWILLPMMTDWLLCLVKISMTFSLKNVNEKSDLMLCSTKVFAAAVPAKYKLLVVCRAG